MSPTKKLLTLVLVAATLSGCAAGRAFRRGEERSKVGDWDAAVAYLKQAVQAAPERAEIRISLERAMLSASRVHFDNARQFEEKEQLDAALLEYRKTVEYDPSNRQASEKVAALEQTIRDRIEAARPKPPIVQMREQARQASAEPVLNPASREPLSLRFTNASVRDILNFMANAAGINVTYDTGFQDRPYTVQLDGVTLEQALNQILTANNLFYKVLSERTIIVVTENPANRARYEEQVIRTFYLSHADATEMATLLNGVVRVASMPVQPFIVANRTANTITIRATTAVASVIEQVITANDKPRAEVVVDVEIMEINRTRAKQFGLNLSQYQIGTIFSPEVAPAGSPAAPSTSTTSTGTATFNLNTISQGVSTADFYMSVPSAIVKFLESDSQTKLIAKPQLRGAEGSKLTLNIGDDIPVVSTTYTPIAGGGASVNPLTSFTYRSVGVNMDMTPRVTYEGDIILELTVESSTRGADVNVAGTTAPSFGSRKVTTKLRLRDGESNLLAGLLKEDERRQLTGIIGTIHIPILKQLFSNNDDLIAQTDIVMLLTPRVVRTHELTQKDLSPIYIGTQQNFGLSGPPPLIAPPAAPATAPAPATTQPGPIVPPGSSPIPGTIMPSAQPAPPAGAQPVASGAAPASPALAAPQAMPSAAPATAGPSALAAAAGSAQITIATPSPEFGVAGGPYMVPISIGGASRVSTITLTLTFNQASLRVRTVQEGSFMRQGGANVTFTQQVDGTIGRVDLTIVRTGDAVGASGAGLLAAILFDAVAPGTSTFSLSGVATAPGGAAVALQFAPASVQVR
jgi:general secretion pathway protein D